MEGEPQKDKIHPHLASELMDIAYLMAKLNEEYDDLKWRVLRGDTNYFCNSCLLNLKQSAKKLVSALDRGIRDLERTKENP